jgi:pilus assembly protein Flp/PilA
MLEKLKRLIRDEEAPTAVEYAIMVAGIAVVIIAVVFLLGTNVRQTLQNVADNIPRGGR